MSLTVGTVEAVIDPELRSALESSWSAGTAAGDNTWSPANPAAGHCDVTSLVIREHVGGDLRMCQVFRNGELSEHHYWNVLPDGQDFDLTNSQFDGSETFGDPAMLDEEFFANAGPMQPELTDRLDRFRDAVSSLLSRVG